MSGSTPPRTPQIGERDERDGVEYVFTIREEWEEAEGLEVEDIFGPEYWQMPGWEPQP